jgi:Txe/YoeB family toxin of Txe-Axe toxin-antitoxin module
MYVFLCQFHTEEIIKKIKKISYRNIGSTENLKYTHLYQFSTGLNKIRQTK